METPKLQFFLSGVSADFGVPDDAGGDRQFLCDKVTSPAVAVKVQEQFDDLGEPMLLALDTYIASCHAVFHLIGDHTGSNPPPDVVRQLLERHRDLGATSRTAFLAEVLAKTDPGISYTQWEAYLALYHDKKLFRFRPAGAYLKPAPEAQREAQARHVARLKAATLHPVPVASRDQLWALMEKALAQFYWTRGVPQPVAPDALDVFRQNLRLELDTLPMVFRRHGPRMLTHVYVEVRLADTYARSHGDVLERHGRPMPLSDVLDLDDRCWVLLGNPGSGKSTLLRRLAIDLIDKGGLPIVLRVAELPDDGGLGAALAMDPTHAPAARLLHEEARAGRAVVLLDGLDEHPSPELARRLVRGIAAEAHRCPVIVASRPIGYELPAGAFRELALCPLEDEAQRALLLRWVDDERRVAETLTVLGQRPRMQRILENPLLLTLVGLVLIDGGEIPRRRTELYQRAVNVLLQRSHQLVDGPKPSADDKARDKARAALAKRALGALALTVHAEEGAVVPPSELIRVLAEHSELHGALGQAWGTAGAFLEDVAHRTGLLVPVEEPRDGYLFPHRSLREYLAAEALEADLRGHGGIGEVPEDVLQAAIRGDRVTEAPPAPGVLGQVLDQAKAQPATWSEVLALACGLVGDGGEADRLVRRVAATGSAELVARVVSEAEGIAGTTVLAALGVEAGQQQWEARRDLLQQLPELVSDAGVVMGLLHQFASSTSHGADLWWAHHQLAQLAVGLCGDLSVPDAVRHEARARADAVWAGHRAEARTEALALLDEQWRTLPEGEFWMGSPESEEGRHADEGPQHLVRVIAPFEMQAVPVTNHLYELFDPHHASERRAQADRHPVAGVTWYEAAAFAAWLTAGRPGATIRLATEVEWEYACRGQTAASSGGGFWSQLWSRRDQPARTTRFWSGDADADLERVGWVSSNSGLSTHPVGERPANPFGLHDLHGNVWEWCADAWDALRYSAQAEERPYPHDPCAEVGTGPDPGARRVFRGGSYFFVADGARSAYRNWNNPWFRNRVLGFRLVRVPAPQPGGRP